MPAALTVGPAVVVRHEGDPRCTRIALSCLSVLLAVLHQERSCEQSARVKAPGKPLPRPLQGLPLGLCSIPPRFPPVPGLVLSLPKQLAPGKAPSKSFIYPCFPSIRILSVSLIFSQTFGNMLTNVKESLPSLVFAVLICQPQVAPVTLFLPSHTAGYC